MPNIPTSKRPAWMGERKAFGRMKADNKAFYNSSAWRALALKHKLANPLCINHEQCRGMAEVTDHIQPIEQGGKRYDWDNLQSLCKRCNASKTGKQAHKL